MSDKEHKDFGSYLRSLREYRELSAKAVEDGITKLYPSDKSYHISAGYLNSIERGEKPPPHPLKLKALSQLYGEKYELMLYRAGYLDRNPATEPHQWNKQAIRDLYLEQFPQTQKVRSLTEGEKKAVDKFVDNLITTLITRGS